jgi:ribosomal protein L34E
MVSPGERSKKKKFVRMPSGRVKTVFVRGKTSKKRCPITGEILHGVPHGKTPNEIRKLSKTERRPETIFGGVLSSRARTMVIDEAAKVYSKIKSISDVDLKLRNYVKAVLGRLK